MYQRCGVPGSLPSFALQMWIKFLGFRFFCEGNVEQYGQQRRSHAHSGESLGLSPAWDKRGTMCTAKGSDTRPGVPRFPPRLYGRRGLMCAATGTDVRSGAPWSPPFLHHRGGTRYIAKGWTYALTFLDRLLVCVAGVEQFTSPRGRIYALASLNLRLVCVGRHGTIYTATAACIRMGPFVPASFALILTFTHPLVQSLIHSLIPLVTHLLTHSVIHQPSHWRT